MKSQSFQPPCQKGHDGSPEGLSFPSSSDPSGSSPLNCTGLLHPGITLVGSTALGRAWAQGKGAANSPWAWAQLPLYLEELDSLRLQGLGGQGGEGGVQPVFAVAQHGVPPEGGICPEHSTREQRPLPLRRELASPAPRP